MVIKEVLLPGIGVRYEFACRSGDRIGIIARRGGDVEVVCDARDDPDQARPLLRLTQDEANAAAQVLGAPHIAGRFTELTQEVPGIATGRVQVSLTSGGPAAGGDPYPHPHRSVDRAQRPGDRLAGPGRTAMRP